MDYSGNRIGPAALADGVAQTFQRGSREGATVSANLGGIYEETNVRGNLFTLVLAATSTGIAAGHQSGAAAAASTQFAVVNPLGSGKNLVLIEFCLGIISGTMPAGPVLHAYIPNTPTLAASGTVVSNLLGAAPSSVAKCYTSAGGAALTGGAAPVNHKVANFASTNTAQASPYLVSTVEYLDGKLAIPPNTGWLPMFSGAGTSLLCGLSVTWREVPV